DMNHHMRAWSGQGANAFVGYVSDFTQAADLQSDLAQALALTMDANREVRERMLTDVWSVGHETLKVLDALHPFCGGDAVSTASVTISVLVATASVFAAIPSGGVSTLLAAGGFASTMLSTIGSAPKAPIGGGTVLGVIDTMRTALQKVQTGV